MGADSGSFGPVSKEAYQGPLLKSALGTNTKKALSGLKKAK